MSDLPKIYWNNLKRLEREWIDNEIDWWPDTIALPDADPSSCSGMPRLGIERIKALAAEGKQVCDHIAVGVHCWRIGLARDFLPNTEVRHGGRP